MIGYHRPQLHNDEAETPTPITAKGLGFGGAIDGQNTI